MDATVTALDEEIAQEERRVGIDAAPSELPGAISRRQAQIAMVLALVVTALVGLAFTPTGLRVASPPLRGLTTSLAVLLVVYAVEQNRHLRRLDRLAHVSNDITLAVADAITSSGALTVDDELLRLRHGFARASDALAEGLAEVLQADAARVRIPGPSDEVAIAARHDRVPVPDDGRVAWHALRRGRPVQRAMEDGRVVLAVPVWHGGEAVAVLEAVSDPGAPFVPRDAAVLVAFGRGALAGLRAP
jgi:hypothetical protein